MEGEESIIKTYLEGYGMGHVEVVKEVLEKLQNNTKIAINKRRAQLLKKA